MSAASQKTVVVTGATRGIGLAFVDLYMRRGWKVIATARNVDAAIQLRALSPYRIIALDTSVEQSIVDFGEELKNEIVDLVINNAGIASNDTLQNATKEKMMKQFEVNAVGPFLVTRAVLSQLRSASQAQGYAVVANISSVMGSLTDNCEGGGSDAFPPGGYYAYRTSKTALNMITATLAVDLKRDNIIVLALHPGYVATDMTGHTGPVTTVQSVEGLSNVIEKAGFAISGKFFDFENTSIPW